MLNFLPDDIFDEVSPFIGKGLDELRIRADKPVFALINGKFVRLGGVVPTKTHIEKAIIRLTGHSVYNYEQSIKLGYITGDEGERVCICGDCVVDGQVKFIKNVTSLCVRVPSDLTGCAKTVAAAVFAEGIKNVLVISPPGAGKTTILRDLARIASDELGLNVLVV
ncbi:MAG: hypothetical protein ILP02_03420, partial [Clostridia bacterium]|nr:hypothetical protein [Clostridia bacterium]